MAESPPRRNPFAFNIRGNLVAGILALAPLVAAWLVFSFLVDVLFDAGAPLAGPIADIIEGWIPQLTPILSNPTVQEIIAVLLALSVIYAVGFVTSRVIGMRLMGYFERVIARIPVVEIVYSAVKKLVNVIQRHPDDASRVVLIEFPHPGARAIGLVMRSFKDAKTGEELAAVLVPTAPNPTTGYLQIVAARNLTPTDMSIDQAMSMIISGGAQVPEHISLARP
jgi:uncharacterized membrane protein